MIDPNQTVDESAREEAPTVFGSYAPQPDQPERIGRYRIERILGKGGFGIVYLAHDEQLHRLVAIKVPHRHRVLTPEDAAIYWTEARTVANLDHPHIVPVHDVGSTELYPCYVVSKFIDGTNLAAKLKHSQLPPHQAVELTATVAEALHHAHTHGLVHRDVKPGNILLDHNGQPFVTDFGMALREQDVGKGPRYAGTPAYMSPEQAHGEGHRVDGRSDIFSLGVVLYELMTGRRPFKAESREELLEQIAHGEVRPPRQIDDSIPNELERICLKAIRKRASERYTTAKDMADDLRQLLKGSIVLANAAGAAPLTTADPGRAPASDSYTAPVVPRGLRAFDADDADFFLDLLPGPCDRHGLPESIRFWKSHIDQTDAEETFAIGLLYGPSGCGKSSLVKAGLLPRLALHVKPIYLEATPDLETRLLHRLGRTSPVVRDQPGLPRALAAIRRGEGAPSDAKVLIVLDQFEQWLHAHRQGTETELVRALRQCDGGRLQCLVMVRDDFWMMSTRFMRELEVPVVEGHNAAAIDLFTPVHARKVLTAFGRAYGALPAHARELAPAQAAFLDHAVAELTQDGWVIPVRLALFAEMVKRRPWTGAVLRELGGAVGIGVTFLEETFTAPTAPPEHRLHQRAVHDVLNALLPAPGTDIRGAMRSRGELLEASGYRQTPAEFDALMRILDSKTRLLTPMASDPSGADAAGAPAEQYYQLTHDYLVPSVREWLTRKQKETWRGRAELRLAERGTLWQAKPEQRQLPSRLEWLAIRMLTTPRSWTDSQRQMMQAAARTHLLSLGLLLVVAGLFVGAALFVRGQLAEDRAASRADGLVRRLLDANVAQAPAIIDELADYRQWTDPQLEQVLAEPTALRDHHLRAHLALLPVDRGHVDGLREMLLESDPYEFPIIRDALKPYRADLVEGYWQLLACADADAPRRFRAAVALAAYDPGSPHWEDTERWVAEQLIVQPSLVLPRWVEALRPIKDRLIPALVALCQNRAPRPAAAVVVAEIVGDYAADQPALLAEALGHAAPDSFAILLARLQTHAGEAMAALTALLDHPSAEAEAAPQAAASQRANLAIALLRLGDGDRLWPLLKASPDPRVRSFAIDRFAALGCDPAELLARLETELDDTIRAALWLGLGGFDDRALPAARRLELTPRLLAVYRLDESAAVHAAVHWLLGRWDVRDGKQAVGRLPADADKGKKWYVNAVGQTMVRITGPVTFLMGALPDEPGRKDVENAYQARIDYSYDIGMTEVTIGQFQCFLEHRLGQDRRSHYARQATLAADTPITKVSWYDAAAYCNWLSEAEGIPPDQWCYEPTTSGKFGEGMKIVPQFRRKLGYRLPTEAEWEYACRGGAVTSRCYGDTDELLPRYAWYAANATEEHAPVAQLLPNALGCFDMHGNTSEWCQDLFRGYGHRPDSASDPEVVLDFDFRSVRGGSLTTYARAIRSAKRFADRPPANDLGGFRIARSRP